MIAPDPLRYGVPLPLQVVFYPLGFPVRISTNSAQIVAAASEIWGECELDAAVDAIDIRLAVSGRNDTRPDPAPLPFGQQHLMTIVHSVDNFAAADVDRGFVFGWLTEDTVEDHGYFRYHFLEPFVYLILDCLYLTPIHAACVALEGRGMLLCGDSGAGKTSLAYALARRGWTYIADDAAHLVRCPPGRRIRGRAHQIRFRSTAKTLFPELAEFTEVMRPNGKLDLELSTAGLGLPSIATETELVLLVFLRREAGAAARLEPFRQEDALAKFEQVLCFGPEHVRAQQRASLKQLTGLRTVGLSYSDLDSAEHLLRSVV